LEHCSLPVRLAFPRELLESTKLVEFQSLVARLAAAPRRIVDNPSVGREEH
jgi:hypothetical protein